MSEEVQVTGSKTLEETHADVLKGADIPKTEFKPEKSPSISSINENNTSDEHIENLLKEVEEMRVNNQSSPLKVEPEASLNSTANTTILSTSKPQDDTALTIDSSTETKKVLQEVSVQETTRKANIPNSVSQALFSQPLKVTKIREKSPTPKFVGIKKPTDPAANKRFEQLQKKDQELTKKISKLHKEIDYLKSLVETVSVTSDLSELRKLKYAVEKLEEYLDKKQKEKYEVGIQLTRAVRKRVDSGESGEFWVN